MATESVEEMDKILADYDVGEAICVKCRHDIYLHYWNGAGNPENSGWDSCKADGCECIGEEIEFEPNTAYECPLKTEFVPSQGAKAALQAYYTRESAKLEKAYGGCHNCYGKGYATGADLWSGVDTDQDIGSPGGTVSGGNPNAMKFCTCDRGKQLRERWASYTRECARKVLEGRKEQVMQDFLELSVASFTDGVDESELIAWRDKQFAELSAAIKEVGGGDGKER